MTHDLLVDPFKANAANAANPAGDLCDPQEATCQLLECLERPDFFCGQHLTDEDLDAIVQWTRGRFRLSRLREGWGVVCGMNVTVDTRNSHRPVLHVSPGYAVDGCGEDIIACDDLCYPIWKDCSQIHNLAASSESVLESSSSLNNWRNIHEALVKGWDWDKESRHVRSVDLYVCFDESQTVPGLKPGCSPDGRQACDYKRWRESASLKVEPASSACPDTCQSQTDAFNERLELIGEFRDFYNRLPDLEKDPVKKDPEKIRKWFLDQIDGRGQQAHLKLKGQRIPFVRNWVAHHNREDLQKPDVQARILYYLIFELRLQLLSKKCPPNPEPRVRLARIWLYMHEDSSCCDVIGVDSDSPYRREFGPDEEHCIPNRVDLGQVYGMDHKKANTMLGVTKEPEKFEFETFDTSGEMFKFLHDELYVRDLCNTKGVVLRFDPFTNRVIDFRNQPGGIVSEAGPVDVVVAVEPIGGETEDAPVPEVETEATAAEREAFREFLISDKCKWVGDATAGKIIEKGIDSIARLIELKDAGGILAKLGDSVPLQAKVKDLNDWIMNAQDELDEAGEPENEEDPPTGELEEAGEPENEEDPPTGDVEE